ncbi:MAG TPA: hypothetical protein VEK57_07095 [Thermoanaerobaculia bacterium]|nr:hypothetical protein [Thermoanaerobaculia bacterium]
MRRVLLGSLLLFTALSVIAGPALRTTYAPLVNTVSLSWSSVPGAAYYDVERTAAYPSWSFVARLNSSTTNWSQSPETANSAQIYRIVPRDSSLNAVGTPSNAALITTHDHLDNPLVAGVTPFDIGQLVTLRAAMTSLRAAAGVSAPAWTQNPVSAGTVVSPADVTDLRTAFNGAVQNLGLPLPSYADAVGPDEPIRRTNFQQLRDLVRSYPEWLTASAAVSEAYFSPNGDGTKDSTTFTSTVTLPDNTPRVDFRWRVDVRNSSNAVVRSAAGSGVGIIFVWDGKNGAAAVQPTGMYTFELVDLDGLATPIATGTTRIDITAPTATIAAPVDSFLISNVRTGGSGSVTITGTTADETAFSSWTLKRKGNGQTDQTLASGSSAVTAATLATWQTNQTPPWVPNGNYTLELAVTDLAGNQTTDVVPVTVGHFSVARPVFEANHGNGETVTYTTVVPFSMNVKLEIRRGAVLVRTLTNQTYAAGTHNLVWNGRGTDGKLVQDGAYNYLAVASDAMSIFTWDKSTLVEPSPTAKTQYRYPDCWTGSSWVRCDTPNVTFQNDPWAGTPLRIRYCVASENPDGCAPRLPAHVIIKATDAAETTETCNLWDCLTSGYQPSGSREFVSYGTNANRVYFGAMSRLTVIREFDKIFQSTTVLYGADPVITNVSYTPLVFSPASVPSPVNSQVYTLSVPAGRTYTVKAEFRYGSELLRTVTTGSQTATNGTVQVSWDGRATNQERVVPGHHHVTLTVTDVNEGVSASTYLYNTVRY